METGNNSNRITKIKVYSNSNYSLYIFVSRQTFDLIKNSTYVYGDKVKVTTDNIFFIIESDNYI